MPSATPCLSRPQVADLVRHQVFGAGSGTAASARQAVGVELEWLTGYRRPDRRLALDQAQALVADLVRLPGGSRLTIEPGGQLELSSKRCTSAREAVEAVAADLYRLDLACTERRIHLVALGADPQRPPERVVTAPRYAAMERFFDADNRAGRTMMCNTAAIQVNLGLGEPHETVDRWHRANRLGPVLIASFANSPLCQGHPCGWQSSRLRAWWTLDPTRSAPVPLDGDPAERWAEYALDARVMLVRHDGDDYRPVLDGLTFRDWMTEGHDGTWPTADDLAYHLTTLFPPVRPKGWFELRMFDALPTPFWHVAVLVAAALVTDPDLGPAVDEVVGDTAELWIDAAQLGLGHPGIARAARDAFELAVAALAGRGDEAGAELVAHYADRWVRRGRAPADDRLDAWRERGELYPPMGTPEVSVDVALGAPGGVP